jgi:AhpD family alkylhydroperoxidase
MKLSVYDPPMCCPTGVCGPAVDPAIVRFAADLEWLQRQGIEIERFNLAQQPAAFAQNPSVSQVLRSEGNDCLPLVMVDGVITTKGSYPSREKLAEMAHLTFKLTPTLVTEAVAELIAIGASIASNCEPCFRYHYDKARKLGVSREDMALAVAIAQGVKETPAKSILDLADKYLKSKTTNEPVALPMATIDSKPSGKCC